MNRPARSACLSLSLASSGPGCEATYKKEAGSPLSQASCCRCLFLPSYVYSNAVATRPSGAISQSERPGSFDGPNEHCTMPRSACDDVHNMRLPCALSSQTAAQGAASLDKLGRQETSALDQPGPVTLLSENNLATCIETSYLRLPLVALTTTTTTTTPELRA
ncbi:hypothetical protein C7974DRAFT_391565 [Boeremia exigua]|uniref:uncharacterized protein n=1 Tax=Boeremia exigua TaxID=749465 RepID=UPI001E8EC0AF|nr:uncharacterized protein C7974DRAFT_391565 [Boeremia exigua]KAH6638425.1 hypothetical protein C7974DRAFT_391565 [Boeremia exigua]